MKVLAIVISYFPNKEDLTRNIEAFKEYVDKILIWENTPEDMAAAYRFVHDAKVFYCGSGENVGIPKALNYAWHLANEQHFDYILTMDKDSRWEGFGDFLKEAIRVESMEECVCGPYTTNARDAGLLAESETIITSGALVPVSVLNMVGGWPETFKIDCVDFDFCCKCKVYGVKSYMLNRGTLHQTFGKTILARSIRTGRYREIAGYSPQRLYYIVRNSVILKKMYSAFPLGKHLKMWLCCHASQIILHEDKKISKFTSMLRGALAGILART